MELYTVQISKWRKVKELGIPFIDITVKSGDHTFSPTWDLLRRYKNDNDEEYYTEAYTKLMRASYNNNKDAWLGLCNHDKIAIACYCGSGNFCHRYLLVTFLEKVCVAEGIDFKYKGEITYRRCNGNIRRF